MGLIDGWFLWIWLAAAVVGVLAYFAVRRRRRADVRGVPLAHTSALSALPRYQVLLRRYRIVSGLLAVAIAIVALAAIVLSARPATSRSVAGQQSNRDIMLCLDVSDSMNDLDAAVLTRFDAIASKLNGQRIGLMIFNGPAVLRFPLTDDYAFVHDQLAYGARQARSGKVDWLVGTLGPNPSPATSSLIGDGIASCLGAFDHKKQKRARSIILATDGEPGKGTIYSTPQAGKLAVKDGVHVYVLSRVTPAHQDIDYDAQGYADLNNVAHETKGGIYAANDAGAVPDIVDKVLAQQAKTLKLPPRHVRSDSPTPLIVVALVGTVGIVVAAWKSQR